MNKEQITGFADALFNAEQTREQISPLSEQAAAGSISIDDAYNIQLKNVARVLQMGHAVSGKKIGLTSPGIQQQLGVNEPDYGHLFAAMDCENGVINTAALIQPKIEAELAFVLKHDLVGGRVSVEDVDAATDYIVGAFEIVDSRVENWRIALIDTVADNASSGRYVLGNVRHKPGEVDLAAESMELYKNGELVGEGLGSAVLGDPRKAVAWLANRLWDYGVKLKAGEIILSGAFSAAPEAKQGDAFTAKFKNFGQVDARFE